MKKEATLDINLAELSDEELNLFKEELAEHRKKLISDYAAEFKARTDENFDRNSRKGQKILDKIKKKFEDDEVGLSYLEDVVDEEIAKRENYKEQQVYLHGTRQQKQMSTAEFIEREERKTKIYKDSIK